MRLSSPLQKIQAMSTIFLTFPQVFHKRGIVVPEGGSNGHSATQNRIAVAHKVTDCSTLPSERAHCDEPAKAADSALYQDGRAGRSVSSGELRQGNGRVTGPKCPFEIENAPGRLLRPLCFAPSQF